MKTSSATAHPLIEEAAELGAMVNQFALAEWPKEKLEALIESCNTMHDEATAAIETWYEGELFKPENFLCTAKAEALNEARKDAHLQIISVTAPLCAAAMFILEREDTHEQA